MNNRRRDDLEEVACVLVYRDNESGAYSAIVDFDSHAAAIDAGHVTIESLQTAVGDAIRGELAKRKTVELPLVGLP